jgi:hypothetical protein
MSSSLGAGSHRLSAVYVNWFDIPDPEALDQ